MHVVLIYCRPRGETHIQTLRPWLEAQAAKLSAHPQVRRTPVIHLTTAGSDRGDRGWLLECELDRDAGPAGHVLRELLTDMRLVGLYPNVFAQSPTVVTRNAAALPVDTADVRP